MPTFYSILNSDSLKSQFLSPQIPLHAIGPFLWQLKTSSDSTKQILSPIKVLLFKFYSIFLVILILTVSISIQKHLIGEKANKIHDWKLTSINSSHTHITSLYYYIIFFVFIHNFIRISYTYTAKSLNNCFVYFLS